MNIIYINLFKFCSSLEIFIIIIDFNYYFKKYAKSRRKFVRDCRVAIPFPISKRKINKINYQKKLISI